MTGTNSDCWLSTDLFTSFKKKNLGQEWTGSLTYFESLGGVISGQEQGASSGQPGAGSATDPLMTQAAVKMAPGILFTSQWYILSGRLSDHAFIGYTEASFGAMLRCILWETAWEYPYTQSYVV